VCTQGAAARTNKACPGVTHILSYTFIFICMYIYNFVYMYTYLHMCIYVCIYVRCCGSSNEAHMHITYVYIYIYTCMYMYMHMHMYICDIYICKYIYTIYVCTQGAAARTNKACPGVTHILSYTFIYVHK